MRIYKVFSHTNCRCGVNYGYARRWSQATCLKCKTTIANIVSAKEVNIPHIATIKGHECSIAFGITDCDCNIGAFFSINDNFAMCIKCGEINDILTKIDKPLGEFILNIIDI